MGRFINADAFTSTGQGLTGNNMFAYCLNNPVNGSDPCGTCFHRIDFWNDCEKCGGRTLGEKLGEYAADVYDTHMMQNEWQRQVDQMSFNAMCDSAIVVGEAIAEGIDNMNEAEYQQNQAQHAFIADRFSTPRKTSNTLIAVSSAGYLLKDGYGLYIAVTAGVGIGGAAFGVAMSGIALVGAMFAVLAE